MSKSENERMNLTILDDHEVDVATLAKENRNLTSKYNAMCQGYDELSRHIDEVYDLMFDQELDDGPREKIEKIKKRLSEINDSTLKRKIFRFWCNK